MQAPQFLNYVSITSLKSASNNFEYGKHTLFLWQDDLHMDYIKSHTALTTESIFRIQYVHTARRTKYRKKGAYDCTGNLHKHSNWLC